MLTEILDDGLQNNEIPCIVGAWNDYAKFHLRTDLRLQWGMINDDFIRGRHAIKSDYSRSSGTQTRTSVLQCESYCSSVSERGGRASARPFFCMAQTLDDIATTEQLKQECRIDDDDNDQNDLLNRHLASAVAFCENTTSRTILDKTTSFRAIPPSETDPVAIKNVYDYKSVEAVKYFEPSGDIRVAQTGTILPADLGQIVVRDYHAGIFIFPPASGWAARHSDAPSVRFNITQGIDFTDTQNADLRHAIILRAQKFYDGETNIDTIWEMLRPWRLLVG